MEELMELKTYIEQKDYAAALQLIGEMEEMSRDDKINKTVSFLEILLIHLIKQAAENRTSRSWELSIANAVGHIQQTNKRRKAGGLYLTEDDLRDAINEAYPMALRRAAAEAFEGIFTAKELAAKIHVAEIKEKTLEMILHDLPQD